MKNSLETGKLEVVLENIFQDDNTIIIDERGNILDKNTIDTEFLTSVSHDQTMPYSIQVSDKCIGDNSKFFHSFFKEFIDSSGRIGVSSLLVKSGRIPIDGFVKNHIMNAVLYLNPKRVSRILTEWKNKNIANFKIGFFLNGVNINNKIEVENVTVNSPNLTEMKEINVSYFTDKIIPFYKKNEMEINNIMDKYSSIITKFSDCLLIICNNYIPIQKWWIENELNFFNPSLKPVS